jgi:hypothetical protein
MQVGVREVLAALIVSTAVALLPGIGGTPAGAQAPIAEGPQQPILFSHKIHAGDFKIDCQYCHADARRSEYAGLPSVERCLGCHKITAADRPEIRKLAEYAARREPIPWVRVFKVPEFTHFPHKAHVRAGVACQTCHGPIETMTTVAAAQTGQSVVNDLLNAAGFRPAPPPLTMGWCIDCHRAQNVTKGTHAPLDCVTCHH